VRHAESLELAFPESDHSFCRADPKTAFVVLRESGAIVADEGRNVQVIENREAHPVEAREAALRSNPEVAVTCLKDRPHPIVGQPILTTPAIGPVREWRSIDECRLGADQETRQEWRREKPT
jgi:hypothetical protein